MKTTVTNAFVALAALTLLAVPASPQGGTQASAGQSPQQVALSQVRFERMLVRLEARTANNPSLYMELEALMRRSPDLVTNVPGLLKRREASLDASATLILSLEEVGSPAAQAALLSILTDSAQRRMDRLRAVIALGGVRRPTEASCLGLQAAASIRSDPRSVDVSNTSLLSLGRSGRRLREAGSSSYSQVRDDLLRRLRSSPSRPERGLCLKALGNLKDRSLGGEVANYLADDGPTVRASAAQALGRLGDPEHRDLLVEWLPREPFGAVRAAMAEALRAIPANGFSVREVAAMVFNERNVEARAQMTRYLVEHVKEFEELKPTLLELVHHDPSNQIRLLASTVLSL